MKGKTIKLSPEALEILKGVRQRFIDKFHREPGPGDPVFFDEDADTPQPISQSMFDQEWDKMLDRAEENGLDLDLIYAMRKTRRIVTSENAENLTPEELAEWDAAIAEYYEAQREKECYGGGAEDCHKAPSFRVVELELFPDEHRKLVPVIGEQLLCEDHIEESLDGFAMSVAQCKIPLGPDEDEDGGLSRSVAVMILPLSLSTAHAEMLIEELKTRAGKFVN